MIRDSRFVFGFVTCLSSFILYLLCAFYFFSYFFSFSYHHITSFHGHDKQERLRKKSIQIQLAIFFITMSFFLSLILSVFIAVRSAPIEQSNSTTTFSTDK
jgi:flagellar biosynthesis protein FlhB